MNETFGDMSQDGLPRIRHKSDIESAHALVALGYPAVAPRLPHLLEWVQDGNWPVAKALAPFLAAIGRPILPAAREVLRQTDDPSWKWFLIEDVLTRMDPAAVRELRPDLERLAFAPSDRDRDEQVDQVAREVLAALDAEPGAAADPRRQ